MSPEQLRNEAVDARSDLFSLGCVLYEMATGRKAFNGSVAHDIVDAILHDEPVAPVRLTPDLPLELDRTIRRSLAKSPELRYRTAGEVRARLLALRESDPARPARRGTWRRLVDWTDRETAVPRTLTRLWRPSFRTPHADGRLKSLAVMPMHTLSGTGGEDLLADGVTDALITHLSGIRAVRVISQTSMLRYKGTTKSTPEIARELRVDALLRAPSSYPRIA